MCKQNAGMLISSACSHLKNMTPLCCHYKCLVVMHVCFMYVAISSHVIGLGQFMYFGKVISVTSSGRNSIKFPYFAITSMIL